MNTSVRARYIGALLVATSLVACRSSSTPAPSSAPGGGAATAVAAAPTLPPGVTPDMVVAGDSIFNGKSCKNCHSIGGTGGVRGPSLTDNTWIHIDGSYGEIVSLVTTGFTKAEQRDPKYQFSMNPRGGVGLTDAQIRNVAAYVWSLSHR